MTDEQARHHAALARAGLRVTRQRLAVLEALEGRPDSVTAQELHHELRDSGGSAGLATVYRTLASLAESGALDVLWRDGEQAFRLCGSSHHHHLVCRGCGTVEEVRSDAIESWVSRVARNRNFRVTAHSAEIQGYCASCR